MNERYIYLQESYFAGSITDDEMKEFDKMLDADPQLLEDFEEQKKIKNILSGMSLKNPSSEVWDNYWTKYHNKLERGLAWILISIGAMILFAFGVVEMINNILDDTQTPPVVKFAVSAGAVGGVILIVSVLREKIFTFKRDKYKEIQR